jgi:hypothetical protein
VNTLELKIWNDECRVCSFYTVLVDEGTENETDKFFIKYGVTPNKYIESANILLRLVTESIGNKYGAIDDFFDRSKNKAEALPPKPKGGLPEIEEIGINFPLRLYCYRISETLVILFNGGIKDERTDQKSADISLKFYEAQQFVTRIEDARKNGIIVVASNGREILDFNGSTELFI